MLSLFLHNQYLATSQELTRLEGVTKALVIDHFSETVLGVVHKIFWKGENFSRGI
jgi:ATP-binding cassette, subfamily C (CFTR/MRP), member 1